LLGFLAKGSFPLEEQERMASLADEAALYAIE
jgi:hypothetical protein